MCVCVLLAVIEQERAASVVQADVGPSPPASLNPKSRSEGMFVLSPKPPPVSMHYSVTVVVELYSEWVIQLL